MKFVLVGHPVSHSLSPAIHRAAYAELGLAHEYSLLDCATEAELRAAVAALSRSDISGMNVTIPWKRAALTLADERSELAARLGVANVLVRKAGKVVAYNTDALALVREFEAARGGVRAVVIGNGGAVPAVVAACEARGFREIYVTARRFLEDTPRDSWPSSAELARLGAKLLAWPGASSAAAEQFRAVLEETELLVQSTSAGMHGADPGEELAALVPWQALPPSALAYDLVYAPAETPFLRCARSSGLRAENGLGMLVTQAALAIELWLGHKPALEPLRAAAMSALAARGGK